MRETHIKHGFVSPSSGVTSQPLGIANHILGAWFHLKVVTDVMQQFTERKVWSIKLEPFVGKKYFIKNRLYAANVIGIHGPVLEADLHPVGARKNVWFALSTRDPRPDPL